MAEKCGYTGSIKNTGAQYVGAPVKTAAKKGTNTVQRGSDLRAGKTGK